MRAATTGNGAYSL